MELREAMRTTPATRSFTDDEVPDEAIHAILDSARFAPSGSSRQSWRVVVVRDPATKARVAELYELGMREYSAYVRTGLVPFAASDFEKVPTVDLVAARDTHSPQAPDHIAAAPVLLVILLDTENTSAVDAGLGRIPLTAGGSLFPFAQNVLLAARDLGYGGHLTSVLARQEPALRELLHIPPHYVLGTMIPLGRPTKVITKLSRAPVRSFTTTDTFDGPAFGA
jgi:nitroreductase